MTLIRWDDPSAFWNPYAAMFLFLCGTVLAGCAWVLRAGPRVRRRFGLPDYEGAPLPSAKLLALFVGPAAIGLASGLGWFLRDFGIPLIAIVIEAILVAIAYYFPSPDRAPRAR